MPHDLSLRAERTQAHRPGAARDIVPHPGPSRLRLQVRCSAELGGTTGRPHGYGYRAIVSLPNGYQRQPVKFELGMHDLDRLALLHQDRTKATGIAEGVKVHVVGVFVSPGVIVSPSNTKRVIF